MRYGNTGDGGLLNLRMIACIHPQPKLKVVSVQSPVGTPNAGKLGYPPDTSDPHFPYNLKGKLVGSGLHVLQLYMYLPVSRRRCMSTARPRNIPGACLLACFAPLLAPRTRTAGHCRRWRNYKGGEEEMYAQTANAHRELAFFLDVLRPVSIQACTRRPGVRTSLGDVAQQWTARRPEMGKAGEKRARRDEKRAIKNKCAHRPPIGPWPLRCAREAARKHSCSPMPLPLAGKSLRTAIVSARQRRRMAQRVGT